MNEPNNPQLIWSVIRSSAEQAIESGVRGEELTNGMLVAAMFIPQARPQDILKLSEQVLREHGLIREAGVVHTAYLEYVKSDAEE